MYFCKYMNVQRKGYIDYWVGDDIIIQQTRDL